MNIKGDNVMYNITINKEKKAVLVVFQGFLNEDAMNFPKDFKKAIAAINTSEFSLILDAAELKVIKQELGSILVESLELYKASKFKSYFSVLSKSAVSNMQTKKMNDSIGLNMTYVDSVSDAYTKL